MIAKVTLLCHARKHKYGIILRGSHAAKPVNHEMSKAKVKREEKGRQGRRRTIIHIFFLCELRRSAEVRVGVSANRDHHTAPLSIIINSYYY